MKHPVFWARLGLAVLAVLAAGAIWSAVQAANHGPVPPPAPAEVTTTPPPADSAATAPAGAATPTAAANKPPLSPKEQLAADCRKAAADIAAKLGPRFPTAVEPPFVAVGNLSAAEVRQLLRGSVVAPAEVMWKTYFHERPDKPITILLFADDATYRAGARKLFGDTDLPHYGYCRHDGTLVMNIGTGSGTLVHELTHALIKPDFPDVPDWFNEGLASLHEQCSITPQAVVGHENWRLPALQQALKDNKLRPLKQLVTARDFYGELKGINYAQARYFVMYMQQLGLLEKFYKTLRDAYEDEDVVPAGATGAAGSKDVAAIEKVFGKKIDDVDAACRKWVMTLRFPPRN